MRYVDFVQRDTAINITGTDGAVVTNITVLHPEFTMEDNSMLILPDVDIYYDMITDPDIFALGSQEINLDPLMELVTNADSVSGVSYNGFNVNSIMEIDYNGKTLYYLQRDGLNPIEI